MKFSAVAVAVASIVSSLVAVGCQAQSASSTYTYNPNGEIFNGKYLPGPGQWPGQCNDGSSEQTPVAITTSDWPANSDITTGDYTFSPGNCKYSDLIYGVEDNGVKVTYPDSSVCTAPSVTLPNDPNLATLGLGLNPSLEFGDVVFGPEAGKTYNAIQFHIHSSSEHTIDGETFEAEMHIVHTQPALTGIKIVDDLVVGTGIDGSRGASVVGFMIKSDAPSSNAMFENILLGFETVGCGVTSGTVDGNIVTTGSFNPYDFLASDTCIFNYDGGLTTPTCDEVVEWNLASKPISIAPSQMQRLLALINDCPQSISFNGSTSRPVQPLNVRTINKICPATRRNLRKQN